MNSAAAIGVAVAIVVVIGGVLTTVIVYIRRRRSSNGHKASASSASRPQSRSSTLASEWSKSGRSPTNSMYDVEKLSYAQPISVPAPVYSAGPAVLPSHASTDSKRGRSMSGAGHALRRTVSNSTLNRTLRTRSFHTGRDELPITSSDAGHGAARDSLDVESLAGDDASSIVDGPAYAADYSRHRRPSITRKAVPRALDGIVKDRSEDFNDFLGGLDYANIDDPEERVMSPELEMAKLALQDLEIRANAGSARDKPLTFPKSELRSGASSARIPAPFR
ncbi:hypothetical protein IE81DRAFT_140501 [Ceraceosorus guamensis]|uniref:Uncharacterized protein n=1 Tax=Ceraceosorus guamensis TaxID=1522189 RepID=A0A316VX70_9BASI|nr:hypothetical protein IE81DRAFT_140501 [Ceraceosorus guamensis]PWN42216.1 hypothetical protein IE81DRAFT_140501 [Ceraceosorus guamensis]